MKIPRLTDPAWPAPTAAPVRHTGTPVAPAALPAAGSVLRPVDTAAALRILVEEIKLAVTEQLGATRAAPAWPLADEGPAEVVARLQRFLLEVSAELGTNGRPPAQETLERVVASAAARAQAALTLRGPVAPAAEIVIDQVQAALGRAPVGAPALRGSDGPGPAVPRLLVAQVRAALEERLGVLPTAGAATGDADDPADALAALARLFRAAARDPVLSVRASPLALQQSLDLGVGRALAALQRDTGTVEADASRLVSDLRSIATRTLEVVGTRGVEPAPPADLPAALRTLLTEVRAALADRGAVAPQLTGTEAPIDPARAVLLAVRALSESALSWLPGDARALRQAAEAVLDVALRRTVLQLAPAPATRDDLGSRLAGVRIEALRLLMAAEVAAGQDRAGPGGWARPALDAAIALLRGQEPPFRFDLTVTRPSPRSRRAKVRPGNPDAVDAIETTEPEEQEPEPLTWPRLPD